MIPALELHDGVPPSLRTIVVMPTLLTTRAEIDEQIERLEVHYLASPDGELYFALLSDWIDSATETAPGDDDLLAAATAGIARLNQRHGPGPAGARFLLTPSQARLGRSRRRVDGLGAQARQAARAESAAARRDRYHLRRIGRTSADCPRRRALRDHPRCRHASPARRRQADGRQNGASAERATIRQATGPRGRRSWSPAAANHARHCRPDATDRFSSACFPAPPESIPTRSPFPTFTRICFDEGSYSGKGIYDVDVFEAALAGRVPDNTLLSHDLFEGTFARSGLVSDIELVEEFPSRYDVAAARQHRWARGDWQLLPWILGRAHGSNARRYRCRATDVRRYRRSGAGK